MSSGRRRARAPPTDARARVACGELQPIASARGERGGGDRDACARVNPTQLRQDVGHRPQRLLDVDVGDPGDLHREQRHARGLPAHAAARRERAEQHADRARVVGHQQPAGGDVGGVLALAERSPRCAGRRPSSPSTRSASSAHTGTPVSITAIVSASSSSERDVKPPRLQPLERERLDRRAVLVGVEADVAEEHAVGPRHRLLAQRHRLRAAEAVGEHRAAARAAPAGCGPERAASVELVEAQLGELLRRPPGRSSGRTRHRSASSRAASAASSRSSNDVPATLPPRRANVIVGQIATA